FRRTIQPCRQQNGADAARCIDLHGIFAIQSNRVSLPIFRRDLWCAEQRKANLASMSMPAHNQVGVFVFAGEHFDKIRFMRQHDPWLSPRHILHEASQVGLAVVEIIQPQDPQFLPAMFYTIFLIDQQIQSGSAKSARNQSRTDIVVMITEYSVNTNARFQTFQYLSAWFDVTLTRKCKITGQGD